MFSVFVMGLLLVDAYLMKREIKKLKGTIARLRTGFDTSLQHVGNLTHEMYIKVEGIENRLKKQESTSACLHGVNSESVLQDLGITSAEIEAAALSTSETISKDLKTKKKVKKAKRLNSMGTPKFAVGDLCEKNNQ